MSAAWTIPSYIAMNILGMLTGVCSTILKVSGTTSVLPTDSLKARSKVPDGISHVSTVANAMIAKMTMYVWGIFIHFLSCCSSLLISLLRSLIEITP